MAQFSKLIELILLTLPFLAIGALVLLCLIVLYYIIKKFIETWSMFYSKQKLFNELITPLTQTENAEEVEDESEISGHDTVSNKRSSEE